MWKETAVWRAWHGMKQRCDNPNHPKYSNYGGRGITYERRWKSYEAFSIDMYSSWKPGLTLERIDNNKGYSKDNCAWVTMAEQQRNKRNTTMTSGEADRIRDLFKAGFTVRQIADYLYEGKGSHNVYKVAVRGDWRPVQTQ